MKNLLLIFVLSIFIVSCNKSDISEQVNIPDLSNTNISVGEKGVDISTGSGENINSVTVGEKGVDLKTTGKGGKNSNISVGKKGVEMNINGNKTNNINITSTGGVQVETDSGVSTEEVDALLKDIDKMIDSK